MTIHVTKAGLKLMKAMSQRMGHGKRYRKFIERLKQTKSQLKTRLDT